MDGFLGLVSQKSKGYAVDLRCGLDDKYVSSRFLSTFGRSQVHTTLEETAVMNVTQGHESKRLNLRLSAQQRVKRAGLGKKEGPERRKERGVQ